MAEPGLLGLDPLTVAPDIEAMGQAAPRPAAPMATQGQAPPATGRPVAPGPDVTVPPVSAQTGNALDNAYMNFLAATKPGIRGELFKEQAYRTARAEEVQAGQVMGQLNAVAAKDPQAALALAGRVRTDPNTSPTLQKALDAFETRFVPQVQQRGQGAGFADLIRSSFAGQPMTPEMEKFVTLADSGLYTPQQLQNMSEQLIKPREVKTSQGTWYLNPLSGRSQFILPETKVETRPDGVSIETGYTFGPDGRPTPIVRPIGFTDTSLLYQNQAQEVKTLLAARRDFDVAAYNKGALAPVGSPERNASMDRLREAQAQHLLSQRDPVLGEEARLLAMKVKPDFNPLLGASQLDSRQREQLVEAMAAQGAHNTYLKEIARNNALMDLPMWQDPRIGKDYMVAQKAQGDATDPRNVTLRDATMTGRQFAGAGANNVLVKRTDSDMTELVQRNLKEIDFALTKLIPTVLQATSDKPGSPFLERIKLAIDRQALDPGALARFNANMKALTLGAARVEGGGARLLGTVIHNIEGGQLWSTGDSIEGATERALNLRWNMEDWLRGKFQLPKTPIPDVGSYDARTGAMGRPAAARTPTGAAIPTFR